MKELFFWKNWHQSEKILYWIGLGLLFISILIYLVAYLGGTSWVLGWENQKLTETLMHSINTYSLGIFELNVEGADFITLQQFQAAVPNLQTWVYPFYQIQISLAFVLILGILSGAKRLPYTLIMAVFGIYWANANLDLLGVWQADIDILLLLVLVAYFPLHYYFHAFNKNISPLWRTLIFLVITIIVNTIFFTQSNVEFPFAYLINYAAWIPIILSLIFITMVSHDIIWLFFQISFRSQPIQEGKTTRPFVIMTMLYLPSLVLLYLKDINWIWFDIYYLDIPWYFVVSAVVGIWGFRKRSVLIQKLINFQPFGAFLYITLAIITFATLAHYHFTANDAISDLLRDVMLYSHIAFGIVFFAFILINVTPILYLAQPIHEVIYEKIVFPGNWARGMGFLLLMVIFYQGVRVKVDQIQAGYLMGLGDTYLLHQDVEFAQNLYLRVADTDDRNFRGQYFLGNIFEAQEKFPEALAFTEKSLKRFPHPFTYQKISQLYLLIGNERYALRSLQNGLKRFPNSLELQNNIALFYAQQNELDSAQKYFESVLQDRNYKNVALANIQAFQAKQLNETGEISFMQDSINYDFQEVKNDLVIQANRLTLLTLMDSVSTDSLQVLNLEKELTDEYIIYLYNYSQNKKRSTQVDSLLLETLQSIRTDSNNTVFAENILFTEAVYQYYQGNIREAITLMNIMPEMDTNPFYPRLMGLWLMQLGAYDNAVEYFSKAIQLYDGKSILYRAIAYSEAGDFVKARNAWRRLAQVPEEYDLKVQIDRVFRVLNDEVVLDDDQDRLNYIHYRKEELSDASLEEIYSEMANSNLKAFAGLEIVNLYLDNTQLENALTFWKKLPVVKPIEGLSSEKNYTQLRLLVAQKKYDDILQILDDVFLEYPHSLKKNYFRAVALDNTGNKEEAEKYYLLTEKSSLFDADATLAIAEYYSAYRKDFQKAYDVLAIALQRNPNSTPMLKSYALQCLNLRVFHYGEDALERLKELTSEEEYETFLEVYRLKETEIQAQIVAEE